MNKYELLTIFSATLTDEEKDAAVKKYTDLVESEGKLVGINKWGVKKLAYPINYKKEGYYVLFEFEAEPSLPKRINDLMNIDEAVMRSLCLKKEA
ncbi:MAG: 30S ribosomal protein S6 [Firmicutes bacterium]|nr:30S ribosomal protein S6 [Bacillota bacterium]MDY5042198.1 30S ribosomal protein S6 [Eubacteriales bacterium]